jgi:NADH-quinone oxidoreductase subunit J
MYSSSIFVIGSLNPIHALLSLIFIFFLGTILLFVLKLDYFALLFLIVYVGAIVVLFLFVVMLLRINNKKIRILLWHLFSFRNWILFGFLIVFLSFYNKKRLLLNNLLLKTKLSAFFVLLKEIINQDQEVKLLQKITLLLGLGSILYIENKIAIILAAMLLLLSMIGAIVITLSGNQFFIFSFLKHKKWI